MTYKTDSFTSNRRDGLACSVKVRYPVARGKFPVVIFGGGSFGFKEFYDWVGEHLSENGYIVATYTVPDIFDGNDYMQWANSIAECIDYIERKNTTRGVLRGMCDMDRVGVSGHSSGANGAFLAYPKDKRIKAIVALAPGYPDKPANPEMLPLWEMIAESSKDVDIPVLLLVGSEDGITTPMGSSRHYDQLLGDKQLWSIPGGCHVYFMDEGIVSAMATLFEKSTPTITHKEQLDVAREEMLEWFGVYL